MFSIYFSVPSVDFDENVSIMIQNCQDNEQTSHSVKQNVLLSQIELGHLATTDAASALDGLSIMGRTSC